MRIYRGEPTESTVVGQEELPVSTTAIAPTSSTSTGARSAIFYLSAEAGTWVNYRVDGTAPTALTGVPIWPGHSIKVKGSVLISNSQFILGTDVPLGPARKPPVIHAIYFDTQDGGDIQFSTGPRPFGAAPPVKASELFTETVGFAERAVPIEGLFEALAN